MARVLAQFVEPLRACSYLPDREASLEYRFLTGVGVAELEGMLMRGWRRQGTVYFRPACGACGECVSIRIPVDRFAPTGSQQRAWRANQGDVSLEIGQPTASGAQRSLYDKFHRHQSRDKGWRSPEADGADTFLDNPFATEEWRYTIAGRLVGVGYVYRLPQALSAIYFYYDPDERARSLGTYNVLSIIARARTLGVPHVYLGYYVEGCRSLAYKATFRPNEVLGPDGSWIRFREHGQA